MGLVSKIAGTRVEVGDGWVEIKPLSFVEYEKAERIAQERGMSLISSLSPEQIQFMRSQGDSGPDTGDDAPLDVEYSLTRSIKAWSYEEDVTEENIKLLDSKTAKAVYRAILDLNSVEGEA